MKWEMQPRESLMEIELPQKKNGEGVRGERSKDFLSLTLALSPIGFPFYLARPYKWNSH